MPIHLIRLRKAWECADLSPTPNSSSRVDLPLSQDDANRFTGRVRLARSFGRPPIAADSERLAIRLEQVSGLLAVRIDGRTIPLPELFPDSFEIAFPEPLLPRSRIELDVDYGRENSDSSQGGGTRREGWGQIALVIGPKGSKDQAVVE